MPQEIIASLSISRRRISSAWLFRTYTSTIMPTTSPCVHASSRAQPCIRRSAPRKSSRRPYPSTHNSGRIA
jgi:hypothetical protein